MKKIIKRILIGIGSIYLFVGLVGVYHIFFNDTEDYVDTGNDISNSEIVEENKSKELDNPQSQNLLEAKYSQGEPIEDRISNKNDTLNQEVSQSVTDKINQQETELENIVEKPVIEETTSYVDSDIDIKDNDKSSSPSEVSIVTPSGHNNVLGSWLYPIEEYAARHGIVLPEFSELYALSQFVSYQSDNGATDSAIILDNDAIFGVPEYKQSLDGSYWYYGSLKNNKPDGYGILMKYDRELMTSSMVDKIMFAESEEDILNVWTPLVAVYVGEFKDGKYDGFGVSFNVPDKDDANDIQNCCVGIVDDDLYAGYTTTYFNHVNYVGEFKDGKYHGEGYKVQSNALIVICVKGQYDRVFSLSPEEIDLDFFIGKFKNGSMTGNFAIYEDGLLAYEGKLKDGEKTGDGIVYYQDGKIQYAGELKNGDYHGKGTLYNSDGSIIYSGNWRYGDIQ